MESESVCFLVCGEDGKTIAEFEDPLPAALLMMVIGSGATIRDARFRDDILWHEGAEQQAAGDDLHHVIDTVVQRRRA